MERTVDVDGVLTLLTLVRAVKRSEPSVLPRLFRDEPFCFHQVGGA